MAEDSRRKSRGETPREPDVVVPPEEEEEAQRDLVTEGLIDSSEAAEETPEVAEAQRPRLDADTTEAGADTDPAAGLGEGIGDAIGGVDSGIESGGDPWQDPGGPLEDPTGAGAGHPAGEVIEGIGELDQGLESDPTPGGYPGGPGEVHPKFDRGTAAGGDDSWWDDEEAAAAEEEEDEDAAAGSDQSSGGAQSTPEQRLRAALELREAFDAFESAMHAGDEAGMRAAFNEYLAAEGNPHLTDGERERQQKSFIDPTSGVELPRPDGGDEGIRAPESEDELDPDSAGGTVTDPPRVAVAGGVGGLDPGMNPGQVTDPPEWGTAGDEDSGVRQVRELVTDPPEPEATPAITGATARLESGGGEPEPPAPAGGTMETVEMAESLPDPHPTPGGSMETVGGVEISADSLDPTDRVGTDLGERAAELRDADELDEDLPEEGA